MKSSGYDQTMYLMDFHKSRLTKKIPQRLATKDLAKLYHSTCWAAGLNLSQRDLLTFIKTYRNESLKEALVEQKSFWNQVERKTERRARMKDRKAKKKAARKLKQTLPV